MYNYIIDIENPKPVVPFLYTEYFNFVPGLMFPSANIFLSEAIILENRSLFPLRK